MLIVRDCGIMAITSAFQAEDAGSIPVGRLRAWNGSIFGSVTNFVGFRVPNVSLPASIEDL